MQYTGEKRTFEQLYSDDEEYELYEYYTQDDELISRELLPLKAQKTTEEQRLFNQIKLDTETIKKLSKRIAYLEEINSNLSSICANYEVKVEKVELGNAHIENTINENAILRAEIDELVDENTHLKKLLKITCDLVIE